MRIPLRLILGAASLLAVTLSAQTNLQFTNITANVENAIRLDWQSRSNAIYRIDYLNELQDSNNVWQALYESYPSHGTNTFILDTGDYDQEPAILHPNKLLTRFYRVVETGTNTAPKPFISITTPTNNAVLSGEITVTVNATSTLPVLQTRLYVDGEEVESDDGTNYVINTCEWPNGNHTLFATVKASSDYSGVSRSFTAISNAYAVSSYLPVTFDNFISRISFSEHFFEPDLGQTQHVSAVFAAGADWTLEIVDEDTNVVRTATGTSNILSFHWDGTDDNTNPIPNGVYYYSISATENTNFAGGGGTGGGSGGSPPNPSSFSAGSGEDSYVLLPPVPWESESQYALISRPQQQNFFFEEESYSLSSLTSGGTQTAPLAPKRKPTKPVKGAAGTVGVAYYTYKAGIAMCSRLQMALEERWHSTVHPLTIPGSFLPCWILPKERRASSKKWGKAHGRLDSIKGNPAPSN